MLCPHLRSSPYKPLEFQERIYICWGLTLPIAGTLARVDEGLILTHVLTDGSAMREQQKNSFEMEERI